MCPNIIKSYSLLISIYIIYFPSSYSNICLMSSLCILIIILIKMWTLPSIEHFLQLSRSRCTRGWSHCYRLQEFVGVTVGKMVKHSDLEIYFSFYPAKATPASSESTSVVMSTSSWRRNRLYLDLWGLDSQRLSGNVMACCDITADCVLEMQKSLFFFFPKKEKKFPSGYIWYESLYVFRGWEYIEC